MKNLIDYIQQSINEDEYAVIHVNNFWNTKDNFTIII